MKKKLITFRAVLSICAALGWWGLLYPELVLSPDTVTIYEETDSHTKTPIPVEWSFDSKLYKDLISAGRDKITYRSKLFTELSLLWEAFQNGTK